MDAPTILDAYWARELGCAPSALRTGGVQLVHPIHRDTPRWMGWLVPFQCLQVDEAAPVTGVVSVVPSLAPILRLTLPTLAPESCLPPTGTALLPFLRAHLPFATPKFHRILACPADAFIPAPAPWPITQLAPDDPFADWYRLHFDGPVFVIHSPQGSIAAWAAIKCKSDGIWEMAVATDPPYRGRGLARSVVTHATQAALTAGKVPMYLHELSNTASARVCAALGYQPYGYELMCEGGRIMPTARTAGD
jgi:GNAT superfamily N-acetyltransferase